MVQPGFFDVDERLAALSAAGDPLERLRAVVDFELFRPVLNAALTRSDRSRGGRPPYDPVLMFKVFVLGWPTWPTTSPAWPGSKPERRPPDHQKAPSAAQQHQPLAKRPITHSASTPHAAI